jgi:hypothetical protein
MSYYTNAQASSVQELGLSDPGAWHASNRSTIPDDFGTCAALRRYA